MTFLCTRADVTLTAFLGLYLAISTGVQDYLTTNPALLLHQIAVRAPRGEYKINAPRKNELLLLVSNFSKIHEEIEKDGQLLSIVLQKL